MTAGSPRFDPDYARIESLNRDCHAAVLDRAALQQAMRAQGEAWHDLVAERCPHLFAAAPVFVSAAQLRQMREVIAAVERVVKLPGWQAEQPARHAAQGAFYGYDFHLNEQGAHLIEINTNAGGGFLNALLLDSQRDAGLPGGDPVAASTARTSGAEGSSFDTSGRTAISLGQEFLDMFRNEWRLARGAAPLTSVAIVDEQPETQYLYPEFLLAQALFEQAGIAAHIVDPSVLQARDDGLYFGESKIDLIYNRLTDFTLAQHAALGQAYRAGLAVVTPHPSCHAQYADKRNLARLTDAEGLRALGANEADIATLQAGIPLTRVVQADMEATLWAERKQWFFKPNSGFGSKGAYRGEKLTRRVFGEIMHGDYVAQKLAPPGERSVCVDDAEPVPLKFDVRCYVYDGQVQLVAARLYQGQTTNFRTPGGGFAVVRVLG